MRNKLLLAAWCMALLPTVLLAQPSIPASNASTALFLQGVKPVIHFPQTLPKNCGDGLAKLYDECSDQSPILQQAIKYGNAHNKTVLIVYGGEWCIWCHVFDKYLDGEYKTFNYAWRQESGKLSDWQMQEKISQQDIAQAIKLNNFVAKNFVIAHIEADNTNGKAVIAKTGVDIHKVNAYPYIFTVNAKGRFSAALPSPDRLQGLEIRQSGGEEFRGYNRQILLEQLEKLRQKDH